jgi:hypothetical protein
MKAAIHLRAHSWIGPDRKTPFHGRILNRFSGPPFAISGITVRLIDRSEPFCEAASVRSS